MTLPDEHDLTEVGRQLGHDFFIHSRLPRQADWPAAVSEGFDAAAFQALTRHPADRFGRKWLQLRLGALRRGRSVAADVTPELLRELDVALCPVSRQPLAHGSCTDQDWSVDRLNNDGAYARGNLAVMSTRVNRAKGARCFAEVHALSQKAGATDGLAPVEWLRLAALMLGPCFATQPQDAPELPLCVALPCHSTRLALQQIQRLFTLEAARPAGKNRLARQLMPACSSEAARRRLQALADAIHLGLKQLAPAQLCWDVWLQPAVMAALRRWREALDLAGWRLAARISCALAGAQRQTQASLQSWRLATRGYVLPMHLAM